MREKYKIIFVYFLIFCISFSSISLAATGTGSFDSFENLFPLSADIDYYNDANSHYLYQVVPDASLLVDNTFQQLQVKIGTDINIDDFEYFFYVVDRQTLGCVVWYENCRPYVTVDVHDAYYQLEFHANHDCNGNNPFCLYFGRIYKSTSSSSSITYSFYEVSPGSSRLDSNMRFSTSLYSHVINSSWNAAFYPIIQKNADIDVEYLDSVFPLFPSSGSDVPSDPEDDIIIPDIPEDTDSSIVTLIKSIASFFSQLFGKLKSLFNNLINNIKDFIQDIIDTINNVLFEIEQIFHGITSIFDALYSYGLDASGEFSVIKMIEVIFIPDDVYFERKFNTFWDTNFSWVLYGSSIFKSIVDMFTDAADNPTAPEIIIPAGSYGSFVLQDDVVWSFDWYLDYKPTADRIIAAFIYLMFIYRMLTSLPSVINGVGSPFVSGANVDIKSYYFQKNTERANNYFANKKRGG